MPGGQPYCGFQLPVVFSCQGRSGDHYVSVVPPNVTMVVYGILFGGVHPVFISMMCMYIETFHVSVIVPHVTMVVYGILVGGVHPMSVNVTLTVSNTSC